MRLMKLALGACLAAMTVASPAHAKRDTPAYTSLTVFGDSLVDAGNVNFISGGVFAPASRGYFQGRFTNGYDYTDWLSLALFGTPTVASLKGGTNFAYGGARATSTSGVPDLSEQLVEFNARRAGGLAVDPNGLYVLNFGGNDVFAAANDGATQAPLGYASDEAYLRDAAAVYADGVQALADLGVRNVLITGFPVATPGLGRDYSLLAEGFLSQELGGLTLADDFSLLRFSYLDFFDRVLANPGALGLREPLILPPATCIAANAQAGGCARYFSFDGVHPTAAIQGALFRDVNSQFNLTAGVPEPATWLFLIGGVGAVGGALRLRRRREREAVAA